MPPPEEAATVGSINIPIRAQLDTLERDLANLRQRLERFDATTANSTKGLQSFEDASVGAGMALNRQERELAATQARTSQLVTANSQATTSYRDLTQALTSVTAANENTNRSLQASSTQANAVSRSFTQMGQDTYNSGKSFITTTFEVLKIVGYLQLLSKVAYAASPALRSLVASGLSTWANTASPVLARMGSTVGAIAPQFIKTNAAVSGFVPAIKGAHDTLKPFMKVADGLEVVQLAAAFPLAAAGAAALSPALRQVAAKEVTDGVKALGPAIGTVAPLAFRAAGTLTSVLAPALSFVAKAALPIAAGFTVFKLLELSVDLASKRIKESTELIKKSIDTGLGVELVQRIEKTAKDIDLAVKDMTETIKKFNTITQMKAPSFEIREDTGKPEDLTPTFEARLNELIKLGNFADNRFVQAYKDAETAEMRYRAIVRLLSEAANQGERLAALNLASTFASPAVMDRIKALPEYLEIAQNKADLLAQDKIISIESVARAQNLQKRLEEAEKILSERWIPAQEQLTSLGMEFKAVWVLIVEAMASALGYVNDMLAKMPNLGSGLASALSRIPGLGGIVTSIRILRQMAAENAGQNQPMTEARARLAQGLVSQEGIRRNSEALLNFMPRDRSKLLTPPKKEDEDKAAKTDWDRRVEQIKRHIAALDADTVSIGRNVEFTESLKTEMQLLNAVEIDGIKLTEEQVSRYAQLRGTMSTQQALQQAGINLTAEQAVQFEKLSTAAGRAAQNLKVLKIENDLLFERQTLTLSDAERQVATLTRSIHGDAWRDFMNSGVAATARINEQLKQTKDIVTDFSTGFSRDFVQGLRNGEGALSSFTKAAINSLNRIIDKLVEIAAQQAALSALQALVPSFTGGIGGGAGAGGINFGFANPNGGGGLIGIGPTSARGNVFSQGNLVPFAKGGVINAPIIFPMARGMGLAGEAGEEGILPLKRNKNGMLGVMATGAAAPEINIHNYSGERTETQTRRGGDGRVITDVFIGKIRKEMSSGGFDDSMKRFGGSPMPVRR